MLQYHPNKKGTTLLLCLSDIINIYYLLLLFLLITITVPEITAAATRITIYTHTWLLSPVFTTSSSAATSPAFLTLEPSTVSSSFPVTNSSSPATSPVFFVTWVDEVVCSFVCLLESTVVSFDFVVSLTAVVSFDSGFVGLVSLQS